MTAGARGVLRRVVVGYVLLCVVCTTVVLVFLGLNGGAVLIRPYLGGKRSEIAETNRAAREATYSQLSPDEVRQLMNETWRRPYRYEPWVGFSEKPRSGRFVTVTEEGFRACPEEVPSLAAPRGHVVYVLGGSTTFGYGVADCETIPWYLQRHLRERYPDTELTVFNFGRGWYYSAQELVLLLTLLREGHRPGTVVFIDGYNEGQGEPHYSEEMRALFQRQNEGGPRDLLKELLASLPLVKLKDASTPPSTDQRFYLTVDPEHVRDQWVETRRLVQELARAYGFDAWFFVQPVPGYENDWLNHRYRSERYVEHFAHMKEKIRLMEESTDGTTSFSMARLLADWPTEPFVDDIHYAPEVNDMLAAFIAEHVSLP